MHTNGHILLGPYDIFNNYSEDIDNNFKHEVLDDCEKLVWL